MQRVQTFSLDGAGEVFALGQNQTRGGAPLKWQVTEYRRLVDLRKRQWREESIHTPAYLTGWPDPFRVIAAYDHDVAFDVDNGEPTRVDALIERDRRAELYHHPLGFLFAATAPGARLDNARQAGDHDAVDLLTVDGERFTLAIDRATGLPLRVVSTGFEAALGDVTVTTRFSAFQPSGGLTLPVRLVKSIDATVVSDLRIAETTVNANLGDLDAPDSVRSTPAPTSRVTADEVAPGIWYLAGEGHHSVLVEFADRLTLIEAPVDERRTLAVIAQARALRPGKPLTAVINTHDHFDHAGGIRTAIAEGLTVITHAANRPFFEEAAVRPSSAIRDALSRRPKPLSLETVEEKKVLTDGTRRLEIYPVTGNRHSDTMLMVYFPAERLLVQADAYQPPRPGDPEPTGYPFAANLLENIGTRGLRVDRLLPIHGRVVPFDRLVAATRPLK